jgi:putative membrane protein
MMRGVFSKWLLLTLAILVTAHLMEGIQVNGFFSALCTAAVIGILNTLLRPLLIVLTLPINILTLGLFTFVINALLLQTASVFVSGFYVAGFGAALFGSLIISLVNGLLTAFFDARRIAG